MARSNCWEVIRCGREPGGANERTLGTCPVSTEGRLDGLNRGKNGGRACWGVPRSHELGILDGFLEGGQKITQCLGCSFFRRVEDEEGSTFEFLKEITGRLSRPPRPSRWT